LFAAGAVPVDATADATSRPERVRLHLDRTTIPELQARMDAGEFTARDIMRRYLHRISELNPVLNAVITVNPAARADARAADRKRDHGVRKPLLGIPVLVKDNVDTTGMPTTAGSWALDGSTPKDAFVIRRLTAAGAIVIGKANLSEWANFRSSPSSSGWSGIGGQTNMGYDLDRNPCGSSSGSAVGVSIDLAAAGIGTETNGSIVCPSGINGIVGVKPTLGLASRSGIVPISTDQDTAGPMARNVTDAAVLLGAMTGVDARDPATEEQVGHAVADYTRYLDPDALDGARIGIWRGLYNPAQFPELEAMITDAVAVLKAHGAKVIDNVAIKAVSAYGPAYNALLCEFKSDIADYLTTYTTKGYPKTLQDLIDFNNEHPDLEGPWNSAIFQASQSTNGRDEACAEFRQQATPVAQAAIDAALTENNLDAIIAPTNARAWVTDPVRGDDLSHYVSSSSPSAIAGYPQLTVPGGYDGELPLGLSFVGGRWDEPTLLSLGYAFEQATHIRHRPHLPPPTR
jgi:amidase